ncbi:hypothetical protein AKO1_003344 [Acrasis kona]|uniref:Uncharacterized protein n=1 Tax=Acrasis kona TaxID=1008807 RepID=A0AAW2ZAH7_9EUKA
MTMMESTSSLFENHSRYQQQILDGIKSTKDQMQLLKKLVDSQDDDALGVVVERQEQLDELKAVRQRLQIVLQQFHGHVFALIDLNNEINLVIDAYNTKISNSRIFSFTNSRRPSQESVDSGNTVTGVVEIPKPVPKKNNDFMLFEEFINDEPGVALNGSSSTVPSPRSKSPRSNSPKLNPSHFQSPPSPTDSFFDGERSIVSPLLKDDDVTSSAPSSISSTVKTLSAAAVSTSSTSSNTVYFSGIKSVDEDHIEPIVDDTNIQTVHNEISTTTIMTSGDDDTLTDDIDTALTDDVELHPSLRQSLIGEFESPRQDIRRETSSTSELDKLLDGIMGFDEDNIPVTPIDVEGAIQMLTRSPATSMTNIADVPLTSSLSLDNIVEPPVRQPTTIKSPDANSMLDELIGTKPNGEVKSGVTSKILRMFEDVVIEKKESKESPSYVQRNHSSGNFDL